MKQLYLLIFVLVTLPVLGQQGSLSNVQKVKNGKLIIGVSDNEKEAEALKKCVNSYWKFTEIMEFLPKKEALTKAKANEELFVLSIGTTKGKSSRSYDVGNTSYVNVNYGSHMELHSGSKLMVKQFVPTFKNNTITEEIIAFGVKLLNNYCEVLDANNLKSATGYRSYCKKRSESIKEKTLYIAEDWLADGITEMDVKSIYGSQVRVVSYEEWGAAILSEDKDIAYNIIVPIPAGDGYIYKHYLMDAETGRLFGVGFLKVYVGGLGAGGYVSEKLLKKYQGISNGKWMDYN